MGQLIDHVAGSFNEVLQAAKGKQLLVAVTQGRRDVMFVQLEVAQAGDFYRVNTALPASRDYLEKQESKGAKILWSGSEPRSAATGQQPPYAGSPDVASGQDAPIARGENSAPNQERAGPSTPVVKDNPPYPKGQSGSASVPASTSQGKAQPASPYTASDLKGRAAATRQELSDAWDGMSADSRTQNLLAADHSMATATRGLPNVRAKMLASMSWEKLPAATQQALTPYVALNTGANQIPANQSASAQSAAPQTTQYEYPPKGDDSDARYALKKAAVDHLNGKADKASLIEKAAQALRDGVTAAPDRFANNKLFTADKVAAARERMRKKLGTLNSGIDPELLVDGMTIAGAYIESGVRNFTQYAKAMIEDMGEGVKPYLLSFWEGARNFPGLDAADMTDAAESAHQHQALLTPQVREQAGELGEAVQKPAKRTRKTGAKGDVTLTQDWGVEHIDGYGDSAREVGNGTKDAFLKEARQYLNAVAGELADAGFEPHPDRKGKPGKAVSVNEGGMAGSGEVSLTVRDPQSGTNLYVHIGDSSLRGMFPSTPSGIAVMARSSQEAGDTFANKGQNRWMPVDLSASDLAALLLRDARVVVRGVTDAKAEPTMQAQPRTNTEGNQDAGASIHGDGAAPLEPVAAKDDAGAARAGDAEPRGAEGEQGSGATSGRPDAAGDAAARSGGNGAPRNDSVQAGAAGRGRGRVGAPKKTPRKGKVTAGQLKAEADEEIKRASPVNVPGIDFTITDEVELGKGTEGVKFADNLAAIRTLKQIEQENRRATPDEQRTLARYVGWGGLKNAFRVAGAKREGNEGIAKGWEARVSQLEELLTPAELRAARNSTTAAHYTSQDVVNAVWKAVERLGYRGGAVLEPSVGTGNFIGLMPETLRGVSKVFAVEYDSLTARIAQLLYPNQTIVHAGLQDVPLPQGKFALAIGNPPFGRESLHFRHNPALQGKSIHNQFFLQSLDG